MARHVLRNALIPILTQVVMAIPFLFTGSLLLESFFGIPGLGSITVDAIHGERLRDAARDGLHRLAALHRGADPDRRELHAGRSARAARSSAVEPHVVSNLVAAALVAARRSRGVRGVRAAALWREAARELVAAPADRARGGRALRGDRAARLGRVGRRRRGRRRAASRARSIDRFFPADFQERSYSAPLARRSSSTAARRCAIPAGTSSAPTSSAATCCT